MGLFSGWGSRPSPPYEYFSRMQREQLDRCFSAQTWGNLDYPQRIAALQELENRFAAEQGRPAKPVVAETMEGGTFGGWNESGDRIAINADLIRDGCFVYKGVSSPPRPDASVQLYDTIAHEGYHAYQSYAIEHPEVHGDKAQLEQWRLNNATAFVDGRFQHNYYQFDKNASAYRIQPLERDAFAYGEAATRRAFDTIEAQMGSQVGYDYYKHDCAMNSYDNSLREAQRMDPQIEEHMQAEMRDREQSWAMGQRCESATPIVHGREVLLSEAPEDLEALKNNFPLAAAYENPYKYDDAHTEKALVLGGSGTANVPSLKEQYEAAAESLREQYPDRYSQQSSYDGYMQGLRSAQDELGYYPQLDPRMDHEYEEQFAQQFGAQLDSAIETGSLEDLREIRDNLPQTAAAYRDRLASEMGYVPYEPVQGQAQEQYKAEDMSQMAGEAETPEQDETEDMSQMAGEAETPEQDETEDMSQMTGEDEAPEQDETEDMSQMAGEYESSDSGGGESSEESEDEEMSQ